MFRRISIRLSTIVHSPRAVAFEIGPQDAHDRTVRKYQSRWFGAQQQFLELKAPVAEFVPFFLCKGRVRATYVGSVSYTARSTNAKGESTSSTQWVSTEPLTLDTSFFENQTQLYGGYKYNNKHLHSAMRSESTPLKMRKIHDVDVSAG
eukprot:CAMPEP_0176408704 /NCGR_PEP_ID=MMETSP0127-20121128/2104_1 /TAXON_ID=938130 /ORGANISM="Platyophrya macrostoma, Strain WH" /LENGTH=148 /DNA_ID=CAMNT_0017788029 /DNA_START=104 /DNA_END=546 /DNA_ORIENTATION=-